MTREEMVTEALVIAAFGRHARVRDPSGREWEARPRGRKLGALCGDRVSCEWDATHDSLVLTAVLPRTTLLARSNARGGAEPLVANATLLCAVVAAAPAPDWFVVDRYFAAAACAGLRAALVVNKIDQPGPESVDSESAVLAALGYPVVRCSTRSGEGLDALRALLRDETAVLVGQSGVGKSSLLAMLAPRASGARTAELDRHQEGRHTTTHSEMFELPGGGRVVDSPGVRDFAPAVTQLEPASLGFPEVAAAAGRCRFADCRHMAEPGCAVRAAVDAGAMHPRRYESYRRLRRLFEDLKAARGYGRAD